MMLNPKEDKRDARKAAPASAPPVVELEPGGFAAMPPERPAGERAALTQFPGHAKDSQPSSGPEAYRTVLRCRTKRESH